MPGGQVWLEPGRQAYEHDTGLVRDLVTGQKSRPITPQSASCQPNVVAPFGSESAVSAESVSGTLPGTVSAAVPDYCSTGTANVHASAVVRFGAQLSLSAVVVQLARRWVWGEAGVDWVD